MRLNEGIMTLSRLGGRMLRSRRLVRDHFACNSALGVSAVYLRTVYWRNEAVHVKHLYNTLCTCTSPFDFDHNL